MNDDALEETLDTRFTAEDALELPGAGVWRVERNTGIVRPAFDLSERYPSIPIRLMVRQAY